MHSSAKHYSKIYNLQDQFLAWFAEQSTPFYLTGGTALGRFYLNHRYSEDLDFFVNHHSDFRKVVTQLIGIVTEEWNTDPGQTLITDDYARLFLSGEDHTTLKIEWVNDAPYRPDQPLHYPFGLIDTPLNILANKLTAIMGRDEPKDIFDIIHIALNYAFQWEEPFYAAKQKAQLNELELAERLTTFPVQWLGKVNWLKPDQPTNDYPALIQKIAEDFLFNRPNSFGSGKQKIRQASVGRSRK
jgi:hypothetical protein